MPAKADVEVEAGNADSIEIHQVNFGLLQSNFVAAISTCIVINMESGLAPEGEPSYGWSLWCNMLLNSSFTILLYLLITEKF